MDTFVDDGNGRSGPPTVKLQIADIVLRPEWQVRAEMNYGVVASYVTATIHGKMPPIRLARVNGALMLVDGWHRLAAAKRLERETIRATVEDMTEDEARWAAAEANTTHGLPLKHAEKREVFRRYMQTGQHREGRRLKSYRDIARDLHGIVGKSSLQRWMENDFPKIAASMSSGRDAKTSSDVIAKHTQHFQTAVEHLDQIVAVAPALGEEERRELARRLNEAMSKVVTAAAWTEPEAPEL
jgi:ParB-like chromosome segregation protein Spo0J